MRVNFRTSINIKKKKIKKKKKINKKNVLPYFPLKNVQNTAKTY